MRLEASHDIPFGGSRHVLEQRPATQVQQAKAYPVLGGIAKVRFINQPAELARKPPVPLGTQERQAHFVETNRLPLLVTKTRRQHLESNASAGKTGPPNKELKLTKPGTIGASQLNSSVRQTSWSVGGPRTAERSLRARR
jgi:hypothetical protein